MYHLVCWCLSATSLEERPVFKLLFKLCRHLLKDAGFSLALDMFASEAKVKFREFKVKASSQFLSIQKRDAFKVQCRFKFNSQYFVSEPKEPSHLSPWMTDFLLTLSLDYRSRI